jgi:hypothetical protein
MKTQGHALELVSKVRTGTALRSEEHALEPVSPVRTWTAYSAIRRVSSLARDGVSFVACLACLTASVCAKAHEFSGSGMVEYRVFSPTNQAILLDQKRFRFRFSTSNELWQIRTEPLPEGDFPYTEASCDGTNTYLIIKVSQRALLRLAPRINLAKTADVIAEVYPTDFPPPRRDPINPVWLAYCSGQHLAKSRNNLLRPLWHYTRPSMYSVDYFVRATFTALNDDPFILRSCAEFSDGGEYTMLIGVSPTLVQSYRYPDPYSKGYLRAIYSATEVTNVAGYRFPSSFTLQSFLPKDDGRSNDDLRVVCQYDGTLESLDYGRSDVRVGDGLKPFANVVDYRTMKLAHPAESVVYQATNGQWMPMAPGFVPYETYARIQKAVPAGGAASRPRSGRRAIVIAIMLGLTVIPVVSIAVATLFKRRQHFTA